MSHGSTAKLVREAKEKHPGDFCRDPRCLWRVAGPNDPKSYRPCPKHPVKQ